MCRLRGVVTEKLRMDSEKELIQRLSSQLGLKLDSVRRTVEILDEGNTVPFITRYRKQQTGGLDENQIRAIQEGIATLREVAATRARMMDSLRELGKLTPELQKQLLEADSKRRLDELYAPFRVKKKIKATEALERGLGPLAEAIWNGRVGDDQLDKVAANCVGKHPDLVDSQTVLDGAREIVASRISELVAIRDIVRETARRTAVIRTKLAPGEKDEELKKTFSDYGGFESPFKRLAPHRVMAIDRGEKKKVLRVSLDWDGDQSQRRAAANLELGTHRARQILTECLSESLKRFINPAVERELRREATESAHVHSMGVFAANLRSLLMQPPLPSKTVMAIDPGFSSGCKVAVIDRLGTMLESDLVFVIGKDSRESQIEKLCQLVARHQVDVIAIGNGTASRETEALVSEAIQNHNLQCRYTIVNEAGASIYSASQAGQEEFPDLDATVRGTLSIGRRLQDPLSELVKIEPQHLGVGMYQHDLPEKQLEQSLSEVVVSCVNSVGVDLNRASTELLKYVSGLNRKSAEKIVRRRQESGPFRRRRELLDVPGIGPATFTQAAGFLRIADGDEPLDATWVHPESYSLARQMLKSFGADPQSFLKGQSEKLAAERMNLDELSTSLQSDRFTVEQVFEAISRPGRDPREDVAGPLFRSGVMNFEDLKIGMQLQGVVSNVVDFGAFVDVGLKNDGLVHISRLSDQYVSSPLDVVSLGDVVTVWVAQLDEDRKRLGLSMIPLDEADLER
ncbi:30S ribosomal protein S1 [Thalassoglobus neptunius]|uniref:30S ribosomal protein S1 n=2 Tax=Thalassoglobus neptunius TaxID=1938619 RepID=A0A5C5VNI1_9PLAN|nr:30S ribosomal protein S1 [Thalassoglobus neptunius]